MNPWKRGHLRGSSVWLVNDLEALVINFVLGCTLDGLGAPRVDSVDVGVNLFCYVKIICAERDQQLIQCKAEAEPNPIYVVFWGVPRKCHNCGLHNLGLGSALVYAANVGPGRCTVDVTMSMLSRWFRKNVWGEGVVEIIVDVEADRLNERHLIRIII